MTKVQDYITSNGEKFEEELFELLRIPSISTSTANKKDIRKAADFLKDQLENMDMDRVELLETEGNPVVYAEYAPHGDKMPTVLVYGHYDVQPPDPEEEWETSPFEPTIKDGDIYARGSADDKGQVFTHVKAIEAFRKTGQELPVNVKFILEGEEEIGSPNLVPFLKDHKDLLECDMVLISDTAMFADETPSITYGLRGLAYMEINVQGPNRDLHSGVYGGTVANPGNVLADIISSMKDENNVIQIPGFYDDVKPLSDEERDQYKKLPFNEEEYKKELDINEVEGEAGYTTLERASARPTLDVNGMWGGYQGEGAKTVLPAKFGAKVSMRLVPDQDTHKVGKQFEQFVKDQAPDSVSVSVVRHHGGPPAMTDLNFYGLQAGAEAFKRIYEKEPLFTREGGSIPIVAEFKNILGAESILMGFGLNSNAIHSPNEHFSRKDFYRGIQTSAKFFEVLPELYEESD